MIKKTAILLVFALLIYIAGCGAQTDAPAVSETVLSSEATVSAQVSETVAPSDENSPAPAETQTDYPVTLTDLAGIETTVASAERIVSLTPSNTEILISVGAQPRIVGADAYSQEMVPEAESVGDYTNPDVELIVSLEPDLILAGNGIQYEALEQMRSLGLPVLSSEANTWDEVDQSFLLVGKAVNENLAAEELVQQLLGTVTEVREQAPAQPISCYYVMSYGEGGNWTCGEGSFVQQMMEYAGGDPVVKNTDSPWIEYSLENLTIADPECIILSSEAGDYEDFVTAPGYAELSAVKNNMVFTVSADSVTRPGPGLNSGLLALSGIFQAAAEGPILRAAEDGLETS